MKTAYVTTLCNGDGYLPGIEALGSSIKATGTHHPMVLMVTPDVSDHARAALAHEGWTLRPIEPIANPNPATMHMLPRFGAAYTKLRAWELTEYDKLVFLDGDTIVVKNIDDLFDRPAFAAAPDFFLPDRFSSGVMVLEPNAEVFTHMVHELSRVESYDGGDQGFLNNFFPDWYALSVEHRLPVGYNMAHFIYQFMHAHPSAWDKLQDEIKIVHYLVQKPWQARSTLTGASGLWWQAYFAAHPGERHTMEGRLHAAEDKTFDVLARWFVG